MFRMHALDVWEIEPFLRQFGQESWLIQSDWLHKCFIVRIGWIPRDFLYSRMMVKQLQLFLLFLLSRKNFWKNHKFSLKSHFLWKRDEFEGDFLGLLGWDYAHSKENFSLYQNRHMRSPRKSPLYTKNLENTRSFRHFRFILPFSF